MVRDCVKYRRKGRTTWLATRSVPWSPSKWPCSFWPPVRSRLSENSSYETRREPAIDIPLDARPDARPSREAVAAAMRLFYEFLRAGAAYRPQRKYRVDVLLLKPRQLLKTTPLLPHDYGIQERLREVQAEGPYYLAGYTFGAMVAFEVAVQLLASGEEPAEREFQLRDEAGTSHRHPPRRPPRRATQPRGRGRCHAPLLRVPQGGRRVPAAKKVPRRRAAPQAAPAPQDNTAPAARLRHPGETA
ncbi:uncharacterized protein LOC142591344 [Dermacentor variabilis]|uniref:uncharacterized protein LOC142591344 n=1 Tax=Dermacentor variabilis TaxID=34621 RepID=UPI003F5B05C4